MSAVLFTGTNNRIQESSLQDAAAGEQKTRREKEMHFNMYNGSVRGTAKIIALQAEPRDNLGSWPNNKQGAFLH
jgi:hypothetical protein